MRIRASLLRPTRTSPQLPELPLLPATLPVAVVPLSALPVPEFARGRGRDDESDEDSDEDNVLGVPGPGLSDETRARVGRGSDRCRTSGGDFSVAGSKAAFATEWGQQDMGFGQGQEQYQAEWATEQQYHGQEYATSPVAASAPTSGV